MAVVAVVAAAALALGMTMALPMTVMIVTVTVATMHNYNNTRKMMMMITTTTAMLTTRLGLEFVVQRPGIAFKLAEASPAHAVLGACQKHWQFPHAELRFHNTFWTLTAV